VQEDLKLTMDHFLMIELLRLCDNVTIPKVLARFRLHQNSKTVADGQLNFRLERMRKLREVSFISDFITKTELQQENISILLRCASEERVSESVRWFPYYAEAFIISPGLTMVAVIRRSALGQSVKTNLLYVQQLIQTARVRL